MADGNEGIHIPQKSATSGLFEKHPRNGSLYPSLFWIRKGRGLLKKSYPQQIISCWIMKLEKLDKALALALGLFPLSHTKMES